MEADRVHTTDVGHHFLRRKPTDRQVDNRVVIGSDNARTQPFQRPVRAGEVTVQLGAGRLPMTAARASREYQWPA